MGRIQQTRYDHLLRRTTDQYGGDSKVGEALEDLFPVLDVESGPMELLRTTGWKFGMGSHNRISAAATTNVQGIFNPVGSGHLVVVTFAAYFGPSQDVTFGPYFTALTESSLPGAERDTRAGVIRGTVARIQREDDAAASAFGIANTPTDTPFILSDQNGVAVLAPGTGFQFSLATVATQLKTTWLWRERVALNSELNF